MLTYLVLKTNNPYRTRYYYVDNYHQYPHFTYEKQGTEMNLSAIVLVMVESGFDSRQTNFKDQVLNHHLTSSAP